MNTDERIHAYCQNNATYLEDTKTKSFQLIIDGYYINFKMKYSLIKLSTSYWFNLFECIKLVNKYWRQVINIGINNSSIA
jgi:hypothetical protein